ncbi:MAG: hypothetical protein ACREUP_00590, partial [Burkholderiales bacterium]
MPHFSGFCRRSKRAAPNLFAGEAEVAGLKAFIFRSDNGEEWVENYYSPLIGYFTLKRVKLNKESKVKTIEEAVSVQFRNLASNEYLPPNVPIRFD